MENKHKFDEWFDGKFKFDEGLVNSILLVAIKMIAASAWDAAIDLCDKTVNIKQRKK